MSVADLVTEAAEPLPDIDDPAFAEAFDATEAMTPLSEEPESGEDETCPFGL